MNKILVISLLILLTCVLTFPLIFNMNAQIAGFHSTDESFGALWNFWWLKFAYLHKLSPLSCDWIAAPSGIGNCRSGYPLWNFLNKWLTILTGHVFTYNLETLFGFFASAVFMYFLVYYLSGNLLAGITSAVIYAFCPYHFARAWQHLGLAQIQWMPLYLLALFKLRDAPGRRGVIFCVLALFMVFSFDLYYAYFMLIATALFVIFMFAYRIRAKLKERPLIARDVKTVKLIFLSGFLVFLLVLPVVYQTFQDQKNYRGMQAGAHNPFVRPFEDLFAQSARPLSYFLPAPVHPVFGEFSESLVGNELYGESFTEHALYLGWVPLVLAFAAFRRWRSNRKQKKGEPPSGAALGKEDFYIGFFVFLAPAAWIFSQPPWWNIFGLKIYMPSFFLYKILPMFRAYCRFGIVVMLAAAVLAGFGLKFISEKFSLPWKKAGITALFCWLILLEFWNYPPFKVIDVSRVPGVYYWLKGEPEGIIIAEYPLDINGANELHKFYQSVHHKKMINGTIPGTPANDVARKITRLSASDTAAALKGLGVKYVLVHNDGYLSTELTEDKEELVRIPQNPGLRLVKRFPEESCPNEGLMCIQKTGPIDVYEITAMADKPEVRRE